MSATKFASYLTGGWHKFLVGEYSATPPVLADGERGLLQMNAAGDAKVAGYLATPHQVVKVVPTVTAGAYGANQVIGGKLTFASMLRAGVLTGKLQSIHVACKSAAVLATLKLGVFDADPSASTFTDNEDPALHANDFAKLIGVYTLGAVSAAMGTPIVAQLDNINKAIKASTTSLFGVLVTSGTPTLGSTSDISVALGVAQD